MELGWGGIKNGALLNRADGNFDVFVTVDRNLEYQQNLKERKFAVVVLCASSNDISDLLPLIPSLLATLPTLRMGECRHISR